MTTTRALDREAALDRLLDESAIRDLLMRYFYGVDRRQMDPDSLFAEDVVLEMFGGAVKVQGLKAIKEGGLAGNRAPARPFQISSHGPTSMRITVDGDTAEADTFIVACLVFQPQDGEKGRVLVRGIQYLDKLVRLPQGWRIRQRLHKPLWQFEAEAVPPDAG